ncbi:MAG: hypothetical protein U0L33_07260 [Acutalibacteraceae bacterium]|nr:hypothetical protein [Acutalibacteraceae bacterium]
MKIIIHITDDEYKMLKAYASAKRKYDVGKGFPVDKAIAEMVSVGLESISETVFLDESGVPVEWNIYCKRNIDESLQRQIYKKY